MYLATWACMSSEVAHLNYMGMMEAFCGFGSELLSGDFIDSRPELSPGGSLSLSATPRVRWTYTNARSTDELLAEALRLTQSR